MLPEVFPETVKLVLQSHGRRFGIFAGDSQLAAASTRPFVVTLVAVWGQSSVGEKPREGGRRVLG